MDIFCEYMVKHKKNVKDNLFITGCVCLAVFLSVLLFFAAVAFPNGLGGIFLLLFVGIWYGAVWLIRRRSMEFEYILTNSVLDIDKIMARSSRKRVISINFKNIEVCAPAKDINFKHHLEKKDPLMKVMDLSGDIEEDNVYFVDFSKESVPYRVFFQPNAKILSGIRTANPRNITVRDGDLQ